MVTAGLAGFAPSFAREGIGLFLFLFAVVLLRAQATYWLGRLAAKGASSAAAASGWRGRVGRWFDGPVPRKGADLLDRWGMVVIPLSFLTVGVQTAVNAAAGLVRMRWGVYTLAMVPGCVLWALLYGFGIYAVWTALTASVWSAAAVVVLACAGACALVARKRRAR